MVASLVRDFVPEPFVADMDFSTLERLSGEYVIKDFPQASKDFTRRFSDMVWRVRWRDHDWCYLVLLLEFQSEPDPVMPLRLLVYTGLLLLRLAREDETVRVGHLPPVLPRVLYNGKPSWNAPLNVIELFDPLMREKVGRYLPSQESILLDERRLDAAGEGLRDSLFALLVRFSQARTDEEMRLVLGDMIRVLRKAEYPDLSHVFVVWVSLVFRHRDVPGNWVKDLSSLEEVYAMFSWDVAQWKEKTLAAGIAQGLEQGMAQGLAQGRAEGLAQGVLAGQKARLRDILENNLGEALPQALEDWLDRETDLERLRRLTIAATRIESMTAFAALVDKEQGRCPG